MPTVIRENGFRLFFYSDEGILPHIHVERENREAKFWMSPVRLARNNGLNASEISKAQKLAIKHEKLILEKWNEYFSSKN